MANHTASFRFSQSITLSLLLLSAVTVAHTQPATATARAPYRLLAGDVVEVQVVGQPDISVPPPGIEIGPDGIVGLPYLGGVQFEGATCEEAAKKIADGLRGRVIIDPQVVVRVLQYRVQRVNVLGAVRTPGIYPCPATMSISDAAAAAGGLDPAVVQATSPLAVRLIGADGRAEVLRLDSSLSSPAAAGARVKAGTTVVFELQAGLSVLGCVASPGVFPAREGLRLSQVLALAGGTATASGDLQRVIINRAAGKVEECNLERVLTTRQGEDPLVGPGDVVFVPRALRQATVLGYVVTPGKYDFDEGNRVSDLLALAKGPSLTAPRGDLGHVLLTRADGSVKTLNLAPGAPLTDESNPRLIAGDQVSVPELLSRVLVSGYVKNPGSYDFAPQDGVRAALVLAGGALPGIGSTKTVEIRHADGKRDTVDVERDNPPLQPNDEVVVPFARHRVAVLGAVGDPGYLECEPGDRVMDMIASAGGFVAGRAAGNYSIEKASPEHVYLCRRGAGKDDIRELNLSRFLKTGDAALNPTVEPGDIIFVAGKRSLSFAEVLRDALIIPRLFSN